MDDNARLRRNANSRQRRAKTDKEVLRARSAAYRSRPEVAEKNRASALDYYRKNKRTMAIKIAAKKYGLSRDEVEKLIAADTCEACGGTAVREKRRAWPLHIDHDHKSGRFRGMLCGGCNIALGNVADSPSRLRALADYLERKAACHA